MNSYLIWHPFVAGAAPPAVELFVTYRDLDDIGQGTTELMAELLRDVGVNLPPVEWTFTHYRASYFATYLDSPNWRDRWQNVWKARIVLASPPPRIAVPPGRPIPTGAHDASWTRATSPAHRPSARCLIIADFPDEAAVARARAAVAACAPQATFARGLAFGRWPQLHIDLGELPNERYAAGAPDAAAVAEACRLAGGTTSAGDTELWIWRSRAEGSRRGPRGRRG